MFKKSRIRIVAAIMGILLFLFAGTIGMIYFFSYRDVLETDRTMLSRYADAYWKNGNPAGTGESLPAQEQPDPQNDHAYQLLTFHSVAFSDDLDVVSIDNDREGSPTDEYLTSLAKKLIAAGTDYGVSGSWVYYVDSRDEITLVVLMDNTIINGSMGTLLRYSLLFGIITVCVLFFVSLYLSRRIVQPLEESYRKQKQFISDAGHELKTPIAIISTNAEILEREHGSSGWLDNIKYENHRMSELVHELLELARTEQADAAMERVDFSRIVTGNVLPFECTAFEKSLSLQTDITDNIFIMGNTGQLEQLVSILLDNALAYAPENSVISVTLTASRNKAVFSVTNAGPPIPEEHRQSLFDRFYRSDPARESGSGHYGLGLAIAKAITLNHGGKINVQCENGLITFLSVFPILS